MSLYPVFADWAKRFGLDAAVQRFTSLGPAQVAEFRAQFEQDLSKVQAGGPPIISAGRADWYPGPSETDLFWPALEREFQDQDWPADRVRSVDTASSTVVAHTPRPDSATWDTKGLVVGYVQSGKTTNFTSVIAKLADVGYNVVIVLSGIHNALRQQTQRRLDELLKDLNPDKWLTMTEETRDFPVPPQRASAVLGSDRTMLAVVKKNAAVLKRVVRWLDTPDGREALKAARVLVVDDEADQASVATGRINPLIRRMLRLMPRCTYLGYTATPFANVFIDPTQDDLYPKSFILNLPRPDDYFGPEKIFGRDAVEGEDAGTAPDGYDMIRTVPDSDIPVLRPTGRASAAGFTPTMTQDLVDAVRWFWLATAARRARGDRGHSTMLIHPSVKTEVHDSYRAPLEALRSSALGDLDSGDESALANWRGYWDAESAKVPAGDWGRSVEGFDMIRPHLGEAIRTTTVVLDNYRSKDRLDYSTSQPVVAIAVGGNTLSRGLTLEGLVVSFFIRAATAYDTLLQMGRWFGFRTGYEDLPRLWMPRDLEASFRHLATVEHEMREDIDRYQRESLTPLDVAVRIRTHPSLRITAKMGAAQPAYVSYAGRRLQTRYFPYDADFLATNRRAAQTLLQNAALRGHHGQLNSVHLVRDVPVGDVKAFLATYRVHPDSPDLDPQLMTKYIDKQLEGEPPALTSWSVALVGSDGPDVQVGPFTVGSVIRARLNDHSAERADIKTLMSRQDRALDLPLTTAQAQAAGEARLIELRNADPVHKDRGLVVLYPIDAHSAPTRPDSARTPTAEPARVPLNAGSTVMGLGIVFPGNAATKNRIQATHVAVDLSDVERDDLDAIDLDTEELV